MVETKTISRLIRMNNSVNGNPKYSVQFDDGSIAVTSSDAGFCYGLTNPEYRDVPLRVTFTKAGRISDISVYDTDCSMREIGSEDGLTWYHCDAHMLDSLSNLFCEVYQKPPKYEGPNE